MERSLLLIIGALLTSTLLSSCSHSSPTTESGTPASAPTVAAARTTATKVDSLNGIPGHPFGEPLSAFPGLQLSQTQTPGVQTYSYPEGKGLTGWFGKHRKEVPFVFYTFRDGKFLAFQAIALGSGRPALQQETLFLLGQGHQNPENTTWVGEKARAFYTPRLLPAGPAEILDVQSLSLVEAQAKEEAARLKAENAQ